MGSTNYSRDDHDARASLRTAKAIPTFKHDADIRSGRIAAKVNASLDPRGVKMREARDSDVHPVTIPIAVVMDTTGSMSTVPEILEKRLSHLMGAFLEDKASGKRYLGDAYPAILIGAIDDYAAMRTSHSMGGDGTLQMGQFESGIEIDQNLENLWLTGHGGGTYEESYELALYFMARHTVHDHHERRGLKGYLFIIGDEHPYSRVYASQVKEVIGDSLQDDIALASIIAEVQDRYHVFFIIPNLTTHYNDAKLERDWIELLGQQNVLKLEDPEKVCEMIAAAVALTEEYAGLDDLAKDGLADGHLSRALAPLAQAGGGLAKVSAAGLPSVPGNAAGNERL